MTGSNLPKPCAQSREGGKCKKATYYYATPTPTPTMLRDTAAEAA